jgi:structural maintenance of chromosome 3 (chondroitin sulfate proteoglycan 6)
MTDLIKAKTELECLIEDAESAGKEGEAARQANEAELADVEARMDEIRDELTSLDPKLEELVAEEREKRQR